MPGVNNRSKNGKPADRGSDPRKARLAAALRANLKRRKAQARARAETQSESESKGG